MTKGEKANLRRKCRSSLHHEDNTDTSCFKGLHVFKLYYKYDSILTSIRMPEPLYLDPAAATEGIKKCSRHYEDQYMNIINNMNIITQVTSVIATKLSKQGKSEPKIKSLNQYRSN